MEIIIFILLFFSLAVAVGSTLRMVRKSHSGDYLEAQRAFAVLFLALMGILVCVWVLAVQSAVRYEVSLDSSLSI